MKIIRKMSGKSGCWTLGQPWLRVFMLSLIAAASLAGCVGDVSLGGDGGGISGTGVHSVASGTVTGFGSVVVGGVHYSAQPGALVQVEGTTASETDLQPGMSVVVIGTYDSATNTGTYSAIRYRADLAGPVAGVDLANGLFTLLGQTVLTDTATVFDGLSDLSALPVGTPVQVSGTADPQGRLHATRVFRTTTGKVKIKGRVSNFAVGSFLIGSQPVAYGAGVDFVNITAAELSAADLRLVEVTGTLSGTTLNASRIERLEGSAGAVAGDRINLRGFIVSGNASSFVLNTPNGPLTVTAGASTSFQNGTAVAIQAGVEAEVTGTLDGGAVAASVIKFEQENNIRLEGEVGAVNLAGGSLTLNGVTVAVTSQTLFKDSSAAGLRQLTLGDIAPGNHLQIGAFLDKGTTPARVVAAKLERFNPAAVAFIQGPVSQLSPLVILGVPVIESAGTRYSQGGVDLGSQSAFRTQMIQKPTLVVKAKGSFSAAPAQFAATELEIEP
jgi:hypothetical protein